MPRRLFLFDGPDRFATGTVGEPEDRTFFLQARDGGRVVDVVLEKAQVAVLAERLGHLLVGSTGGASSRTRRRPSNRTSSPSTSRSTRRSGRPR